MGRIATGGPSSAMKVIGVSLSVALEARRLVIAQAWHACVVAIGFVLSESVIPQEKSPRDVLVCPLPTAARI